MSNNESDEQNEILIHDMIDLNIEGQKKKRTKKIIIIIAVISIFLLAIIIGLIIYFSLKPSPKTQVKQIEPIKPNEQAKPNDTIKPIEPINPIEPIITIPIDEKFYYDPNEKIMNYTIL